MRLGNRYIFRGHAVGFEAHIREPQDHICWIRGAMALPVTGGYGKVELGPDECRVPSRNSRYSFDSVAVYASGDFLEDATGRTYPDLPARTVTAAYVNKLNILDRVGVETLAAHLVLDDADRDLPPRISFGTINPITRIPDPADPIGGLTVDGRQVIVEFERKIWDLCTQDEIEDEYDSDNGVVFTSIVKGLKWAGAEAPGVSLQDNQIAIKDFGRIYLGELLVGKRLRQLTLVRVQLGSDERDNDAACDIVSGPQPWPPE